MSSYFLVVSCWPISLRLKNGVVNVKLEAEVGDFFRQHSVAMIMTVQDLFDVTQHTTFVNKFGVRQNKKDKRKKVLDKEIKSTCTTTCTLAASGVLRNYKTVLNNQ
ncbi:uncharacterized protein LOC116298372 [Actinia tenebrosa]|uniref:Uncharacterized protein LOC116298372 n=1 Tax=Actinia tenebrosa TaxID=6105 RepID=A0A6P8I455_ACTTE|nr:uncharacterized protein LOC116298372 [Actinia tenebrosa]